MKPNVRGRATLGAIVLLAAAAETTGWWTLAYEGEIKARGASLTREHFDQIVANFARYGREVPVPLYHADLDAAAHPDARKAHAWLTELRVGSMELSGKTVATLEGRRRWVNAGTELDVKSGALNGGSCTIFFSARDVATNELIGAYLYSFSLTNNPALTGLPVLSADWGGREGRARAFGYWYGELEGRGDVLAMLRCVFDLPVTATEADALAALAKLEGLLSTPEDASGVDVDDLVGSFRQALRLPALTTNAEVLAEVRRALTALPADPAVASLTRGPAATTRPESPTMSKILILAALVGAATTNEDEAAAAVDARLRENGQVRKALNLALDAPAADVAGAVARLSTDAAKVPGLTAELAAFRKERDDREAADRVAYIADVMRAEQIPDSVRPSLELHAASDWPGFQKAHPRPSAAELAQCAQDEERATRLPRAKAGAAAPRPMAEGGEGEPSAAELDQAARRIMTTEGVGYAEALSMLEGGDFDDDDA